ncbi:MAG: hypothetical protein P4L31_05745, partial [Candidatus Babeliales bacterium]|nr:hypothetical protein [Candidatus Babeliales bacterium]
MKKPVKKAKLPKIYMDKNDRRYIILHKKRMYISKDITERQLIKFIKVNLNPSFPKPKRRTKQISNSAKISLQNRISIGLPSSSLQDIVPLVSIDPRSNPTIHEQILEQQLLRNANSLPNIVPKFNPESKKLNDLGNVEPKEHKDIANVEPEELVKLKKQIKELENQSEKNNIEKKQREIENIKHIFANKTNLALAKILKDHNITKYNGKYVTAMNKDELIKSLETNKLVDYNQMWIDQNKPVVKPVVKIRDKSPTGSKALVEPLKPQDLSSSSSSSSQIGTGTLIYNPELSISTLDVDQIMKKYPHFAGCVPSDYVLSVPIKPKTEFGIIINKDPSSQPGSHWVALYSNGHSTLEYYDSFANNPAPTLLKDLKVIAKRIGAEDYLQLKINKIIQQEDQTTNCGW